MTTLNQGVKTFNQRRATEAALTNEQLTRERVTRLEVRQMAIREDLAGVQGIVYRSFRQRLRWLFTGK